MVIMARTRFIQQVVIFSGFFLVLYNEWFVYRLKAIHWPRIHSNPDNLRVLLVADPQLIGHVFENRFVGPFARWDSDRYLRETYSLVTEHVKPDMIFFLGDLLDEGSISSDGNFQSYRERFFSVFPVRRHAKMVFIPGDNDIGGEGSDPVTSHKTERFDKVFKDDVAGRYRFIEFIKVNFFTKSMQSFSSSEKKYHTVRVVVSHEPLLSSPSQFASKALESAKADVVFSAHEHLSIHLMGSKKGEFKHQEKLLEEGRIWYFPADSTILHEIMVPTCSYRMGVPRMGYGFAVIEKSGGIHYTVLWLPGRFPHLFLYVAFLVVVAIIFCSHIFKFCLRTCLR